MCRLQNRFGVQNRRCQSKKEVQEISWGKVCHPLASSVLLCIQHTRHHKESMGLANDLTISFVSIVGHKKIDSHFHPHKRLVVDVPEQ
jgi:hypothetical protein